MDFNSARDCLFDRWVRENCMRETHFDTADVIEPLDLIRAKCVSKEPKLFSSCSSLLAPKITDVTVDLERSQASATWAGDFLTSEATFFTSSTICMFR